VFSKSSEVDISETALLIFLIFHTDMYVDEMYTPEVKWGLNVSCCVRLVAECEHAKRSNFVRTGCREDKSCIPPCRSLLGLSSKPEMGA